MEKVAVTLHIPKEQHGFLTQIQKQLRQTQGRKVALSEILYSFAQIGLGFAQNRYEFVQNLKQNEQNILQATQNLSDFTQNLLKVTEEISVDNASKPQLSSGEFEQLYNNLREQQQKFLQEYNDFLAERVQYEHLKLKLKEEQEYSQHLERENRTMASTIEHLHKKLGEQAGTLAELVHFREEYYVLQRENEDLQHTIAKLTNELNDLSIIKQTLSKIESIVDEISFDQKAIKTTINKSDNQLSQWLPTLITAAAALYDKIPKDKLSETKKQISQLTSESEEPEPTNQA